MRCYVPDLSVSERFNNELLNIITAKLAINKGIKRTHNSHISE